LRGLGVQAGQTVVAMLDTNADAICAWFATNKLGAISVPMNTALRAEFLRHQITDAGAAVVVCEADYLPRLLEVADQLECVQHVLVRGPMPSGASTPQPFTIAPLEDAIVADDTSLGVEPRPSDLAMLIYTAGTTGPSKGCMISHNYACNLGRQMLRCAGGAGYEPGDRVLTPLPLFHFNATAATVLPVLMMNLCVAFMPRFSVSKFWPEVERTRATVVYVLSSMITLLADAADDEAARRCHGQVRMAVGEPFTPVLRQQWSERFGVRHCGANVFGLTECCVITTLEPGTPYRPGSSGRRNECFDVMIVDDQDREVAPGVSGEILVRPRQPHVMFEGYWGRPADTFKLMRNLWFHTGDMGRFDEDGYFYFVDRKKDYLRRGGENISSFEVENSFSKHPAIKEVAVHAVLSALGEDELKVTAVLHEPGAVSEEALCRWSIDKLPYYAVPRYIEFRNELPKNAVGRALKYQLRDEGCTPTTWDREKAGLKFERR
jgi:crotonobetaine/carnitine-CoA ligase